MQISNITYTNKSRIITVFRLHSLIHQSCIRYFFNTGNGGCQHVWCVYSWLKKASSLNLTLHLSFWNQTRIFAKNLTLFRISKCSWWERCNMIRFFKIVYILQLRTMFRHLAFIFLLVVNKIHQGLEKNKEISLNVYKIT